MKNKKINLIMGLSILTVISMSMSCSKDSDATPDSEEILNATGGGTEQADSSKKKDEKVIYMLPETRSITLTAEQRQMVEKSNAFSYRLYQATSSTERLKGENLFMSPLSVMYVLGMLNDGADGDTERELSALFGLPSSSKELINGYSQALMTQAPLADPSVTLQTANIVATANDMQTSQQYKDDMQQYYAAETASLDFTQPSALQFLNSWCNEKTQGMIPSILDELDPATRMVLMNAVYFKATWTGKFDPEDTQDETFKRSDGQTITVPMMHRKALALYAPGDIYSMLCLPYGSGTQWQMMVLLPNDLYGVDDIIASLSTTSWESQWKGHRSQYEVDIKMSRFSTSSDVKLNNIIAQMGAPLMFTGGADFSLMTENKEQLCVSLLKQKAAIEVSEEGTKASAVTAAAMMATALPGADPWKVDFHANRPFVYIIREASSGAVFFIGTYRG